MGRRTITRLAALAIGCLAIGVAVVAPANGAAKAKRLKPISGKLSRPGYTVIAMAANGAARTARAPKGTFSLRPPAETVTLHLRASDGTYAGPVVLGSRKRGKRAIVGVGAGAKLGRIAVKGAKGYAKLAKKPPKGLRKLIDAKRQARARKGVPLGAGNFGLVLSAPPKRPPAGDPDFDGVPISLDVDDDGDLVLDDYDRSTTTATKRSRSRAATSQVGVTFPDGSHLSVNPSLHATLPYAANADGGSTYEQIVAGQAAQENLEIFWYGIDPGSGALDCGQLIYCTTGGTGRLHRDPNIFEPFPECCDPDHDGLGALTEAEDFGFGGPDAGAIRLSTGVGGDQIGTGDVLVLRGTVHGAPVESAKTVGFAFATPPVVASYDDGQGDATRFSLPLPQTFPPVPVRAGPEGDIVLALKVWRPQRLRTAGDPGSGDWIDMGNLAYMIVLFPETGPTRGIGCPQSTISSTDPNLTPTGTTPYSGGYPEAGGLLDTLGDLPNNPENTFTYTVNLTQCLASQGIALGPGEDGRLEVLTLTNDMQAHVAVAGYTLFYKVVS